CSPSISIYHMICIVYDKLGKEDSGANEFSKWLRSFSAWSVLDSRHHSIATELGEFRRLENSSIPRLVGAKIQAPGSTHDRAQQKRQNCRIALPYAPDCAFAPHLHSQQAVCDRQCQRNR